jgi:hypothetical protein
MPPTGDLHERLAKLRRDIGIPETIHGSVTVDQVYAHYQHEHVEFHHPRGGRAKYLQIPLLKYFRDYLASYARNVLSDDDGLRSVERSMEHLSDQVELEAPREWGDLMRSGHPEVHVGEVQRYDRPPKVHRLTEQELRIKSRAILRERLAAGLTVYFMKNGKVIRIPGKNEPHSKRGRL